MARKRVELVHPSFRTDCEYFRDAVPQLREQFSHGVNHGDASLRIRRDGVYVYCFRRLRGTPARVVRINDEDPHVAERLIGEWLCCTSIVDERQYQPISADHGLLDGTEFIRFILNRSPRLPLGYEVEVWIADYIPSMNVLITCDLTHTPDGAEVFANLLLPVMKRYFVEPTFERGDDIARFPGVIVTLGADPEFECYVPGRGVVYPARSMFPRLGGVNSPVGVDGAGNVIEIRPEPSSDPVAVVTNIGELLRYFVTMNRALPCLKGNRYAIGGHTHVGFEGVRSEDFNLIKYNYSNQIVSVLEDYGGNLLLELSGTARGGYKRSRSWREQPHGIEYRSPSPAWLYSPEVALAWLNTVRVVVTELLKNGRMEYETETLSIEAPDVVNRFEIAVEDDWGRLGIGTEREVLIEMARKFIRRKRPAIDLRSWGINRAELEASVLGPFPLSVVTSGRDDFDPAVVDSINVRVLNVRMNCMWRESRHRGLDHVILLILYGLHERRGPVFSTDLPDPPCPHVETSIEDGVVRIRVRFGIPRCLRTEDHPDFPGVERAVELIWERLVRRLRTIGCLSLVE